jgi:hypothetical protein
MAVIEAAERFCPAPVLAERLRFNNERGEAWKKARRTAWSNWRMKRVRQATPKWADYQSIAAFYDQAAFLTRSTGIPHEVDHVLPIAGKTVCGLHVHDNLRVVPRSENRRKCNKLEPAAS